MDTPITVSSSSSHSHKINYLQPHYNQNKGDEALLDDSSSSGRHHIKNRSSSGKRYNSNKNAPLSNIQKVTDWIKSIEDADLNRSIVDSPNADKIHIKNSEQNSLILVRCDFNKTIPTSQTYFSQLNSFNCSAPLIEYFQKDDLELTNSLPLHFQNSNIQKSKYEQEKYLKYKTNITRKLSEDKRSYCGSSKLIDDKSESSLDGYEVPLSIESRKKELCTYLKLMDPSDKKQIFILQNRRSNRVKNLAALQEKKQLEKDFKEFKNKSEQNHEEEKCLTMKSFKELNMKVNKTTKLEHYQINNIEDGSEENELFHFPFPPKKLIESFEDFDVVMKNVVPRYRRICIKKNIKIFTNRCTEKGGLKDKTIKNKQTFSKPSYIKIKLSKPKSEKDKNNQKKKNSEDILTKLKNHKEIVNRKSREINNLHNNCGKLLRSNRKILRSNGKTLRSNGKIKNDSCMLSKTFVKPKQWKNKVDNKEWKKTKRKYISQDSKSENFIMPCIENEFVTETSPIKLNNSHCEIVTVSPIPEDINFEHLMDDLSDFKNLSPEHKKCLFESRIFSTKPLVNNSIIENEVNNITSSELSPLFGFGKSDVSKSKIIYEILQNALDKHSDFIHLEDRDNCDPQIEESVSRDNLHVTNDDNARHILSSSEKFSILEDNSMLNLANSQSCNHSNSEVEVDLVPYRNFSNEINNYTPTRFEEITNLEDDMSNMNNLLELNPKTLPKKKDYKIFPYSKSVEIKSLQKSLQFIKKKNAINIDSNLNQEWDSDDIPKPKITKQSHYISINNENGSILKVFYIDFNLIVCQEFTVSFWMQTPLGNILGSQNMWIPRGHTQRIVLNNKCIQKKSSEMVLSNETTVAYIELWTKEHKSDIREGPVADIFVTLYFWKQRQIGLDKKVLQLENINGFADDVQYCVIKCLPKIIVSWHSANGENVLKRTFVHAYQLAADYQMISHVSEIEPVDHYVSSLHNIEDCDNLIMGCGENKITLWNIEHGYIIATIELTDIKTSLTTLWVKCDRGFLFTLQQCMDNELRLIAINGINHSWKKLASYYPAEGFDRLKGVCIENGLLVSFYDQGILCWKAETGEPVEEISLETDLIPSGSYLILIEENRIYVKHATTHLLSMSVEEL